MVTENLKALPPEERIKRLKKLEAERKKEIEDAQRQIRESEQELAEEQELREKVPIPEVATEDLEGLSEEGKVIVKVNRGMKEKKKKLDTSEESAEKNFSGKESALEETVQAERAQAKPLDVEYGAGTHNPLVQYLQELSRKPMSQLYQEVHEIKSRVEEKGYVNPEENRRIDYLTGAVEEKIRAADMGTYSWNEEAAKAASITQQMGMELQSLYKKEKTSDYTHDYYKGR